MHVVTSKLIIIVTGNWDLFHSFKHNNWERFFYKQPFIILSLKAYPNTGFLFVDMHTMKGYKI